MSSTRTTNGIKSNRIKNRLDMLFESKHRFAWTWQHCRGRSVVQKLHAFCAVVRRRGLSSLPTRRRELQLHRRCTRDSDRLSSVSIPTCHDE